MSLSSPHIFIIGLCGFVAKEGSCQGHSFLDGHGGQGHALCNVSNGPDGRHVGAGALVNLHRPRLLIQLHSGVLHRGGQKNHAHNGEMKMVKETS